MAMGGILRWKDGRNMPDVHAALFEYGDIPVYTRLNLGCESAEVVRFQGSKGYIEVTENAAEHVPQPGRRYFSQLLLHNAYPRAMREEYLKQWHAEHDNLAPGKDPLAESTIYRGQFIRRHQAAPVDVLQCGAIA